MGKVTKMIQKGKRVPQVVASKKRRHAEVVQEPSEDEEGRDTDEESQDESESGEREAEGQERSDNAGEEDDNADDDDDDDDDDDGDEMSNDGLDVEEDEEGDGEEEEEGDGEGDGEEEEERGDDEDGEEEEEGEGGDDEDGGGEEEEDEDEDEDGRDDEEEDDEEGGDKDDENLAVQGSSAHQDPGPAKKKVKGPLTLKRLEKFKKKVDQTGVVYLSRVPPYMKPDKLRMLLKRYGEVNRVYLTPEDPAIRKRRIAKGGNKRQNYIDGWIEFIDKRDAKRAARELNTTPIGGKATSFYSADLWNLKYLSKFKWNHLTEKIAYDNLVRRQKLQAEIAQAKKEKDFYLEKVEQSRNLKVCPRHPKPPCDRASLLCPGGGCFPLLPYTSPLPSAADEATARGRGQGEESSQGERWQRRGKQRQQGSKGTPGREEGVQEAHLRAERGDRGIIIKWQGRVAAQGGRGRVVARPWHGFRRVMRRIPAVARGTRGSCVSVPEIFTFKFVRPPDGTPSLRHRGCVGKRCLQHWLSLSARACAAPGR